MAFRNSLNVNAFKFGEDKISPSDLGVGRLEEEALLLSLQDSVVRLKRGEYRLVLLEFFETPKVERELWVASTLAEERKQLPI